VLILVVQIAVLLLAARLLGEVAQRLKQPAVVGEILAGILLGPSLLSGFVPAIGEFLVPHTEVQGYLLEVVSLIGAMFLLLITGLETDLALIRSHARNAVGVSLGGLVVPFASGLLLGIYLPDYLLADPSKRLVFALFVATAMSISAIPVIAKVLIDMKLMRRDIGQTIIAAGMTDDTIGWMLLSVVAGLASGTAVTASSVLITVGSVLGFMALSFTLGRWVVKTLLNLVQDEVISPYRHLTLVVVLTFLWGAMTQALGLEAVLGAFVMGVLFGQMRRLPHHVHEILESVALGIFSPIFFAVAGLKVNLQQLMRPELLLIALVVILVASLGKVVGTYAGARLIGRRDHWTSLAFGAGLNARGAMEIIIATIGLSLGILTQDMFSIIVVMAMATSLMAPPALRWALEHVEPEEQELTRLKREELAKGSLVAAIHRVLVPVRPRDEPQVYAVQTVEARLLEKMEAKTRLAMTLLSVVPRGERSRGKAFIKRMSGLFAWRRSPLKLKVVENPQPADVILREAQKHYDLLVLGATESPNGQDSLFNPLVDRLVRLSPCMTLVVKGIPDSERWNPRRILVPTNGSAAARTAAELAFSLVSESDEEVAVLHVVVEPPETGLHYREETTLSALDEGIEIGNGIVHELLKLGESMNVKTEGLVRVGPSAASGILDAAERDGVDLIVLGTNLRIGSSRLLLGPGVEHILKIARCPVVIVNSA
jgi:Kef-type K+ transport system membrane component KefB